MMPAPRASCLPRPLAGEGWGEGFCGCGKRNSPRRAIDFAPSRCLLQTAVPPLRSANLCARATAGRPTGHVILCCRTSRASASRMQWRSTGHLRREAQSMRLRGLACSQSAVPSGFQARLLGETADGFPRSGGRTATGASPAFIQYGTRRSRPALDGLYANVPEWAIIPLTRATHL